MTKRQLLCILLWLAAVVIGFGVGYVIAPPLWYLGGIAGAAVGVFAVAVALDRPW